MGVEHRLISVTASEVTPETARFAWEGRVPLAAVTVLAGPPGQGKTQLMLGACARATTGKLAGDLAGQAVEVLYVSAEDSLEHTLAPRFIAAGGNLRRLHFFRSIDASTYNGAESRPGLLIPTDLPLLDQWLEEHPVRLIVLDPIVAMIPVSLNAHRDQHVRSALAPLAHIAQHRSVAVVAVMHLNKNQEADALNRLSGSVGFGGAARSVLLFAADPDDPRGESGDQRVLAHVKCNVGPRQASILYRIQPRTLETANGPVQTSIAIRAGHANASANDLLGNATSANEATARSEAREFLLAELNAGAVPTTSLKDRSQDAGLSWPTVERAKKQLGIRARKRGTSWQWELPITPPDGLDVVDGVEGGKTIKAINSLTENGGTVFDDDEIERLRLKHADLESTPIPPLVAERGRAAVEPEAAP
jgi:putative DNA primase/helicase